jgi:hypothetical protein
MILNHVWKTLAHQMMITIHYKKVLSEGPLKSLHHLLVCKRVVVTSLHVFVQMAHFFKRVGLYENVGQAGSLNSPSTLARVTGLQKGKARKRVFTE